MARRPPDPRSSTDSPSLGELISCVERCLPPALRSATSLEKIKLFDAISLLYRKRDEHSHTAYERYRNAVQMYYKARHPELFLFQPEIFLVPSVLHMLRDGSEAVVRRTVCAHGPLLYSFDMFQPRICSLLVEEVQNIERWLLQTNVQRMPPNSLSNNGVVLDDFGLSPVLNMLVQQCVAPLASVLFPQLGKAPLDEHHGYVVSHSPNQEPAVGCHVDNSEVTLNVNLCSPMEGGELYFRGVRCTQHLEDPERDLELAEYRHVPGRALLHLGKHRHGAHAVLKGRRVNLVLWCRSSQFREKSPPAFVCPTWCNATNKRKGRSKAED